MPPCCIPFCSVTARGSYPIYIYIYIYTYVPSESSSTYYVRYAHIQFVYDENTNMMSYMHTHLCVYIYIESSMCIYTHINDKWLLITSRLQRL